MSALSSLQDCRGTDAHAECLQSWLQCRACTGKPESAAWHLYANGSCPTWYQSKLPSDLEYLASQKLRLESAGMKMVQAPPEARHDAFNRPLTLWHVDPAVQEALVF